MEASMLVIRVLIAAGIAVAGVSAVRVAAADSVPGKQTLVNRNESPTSETDSIGDREQLRRYFLQSR
jgi:hypothetical protein